MDGTNSAKQMVKHMVFEENISRLQRNVQDLESFVGRVESSPTPESAKEPSTSISLSNFLIEGADRVANLSDRISKATAQLREMLF